MQSQAPLPNFSDAQALILQRIGMGEWTIPTHATADELMKLHELASSLSPGQIAVEIGSYLGASSLMIGSGLSEESHLYCVDTWQNSAMTEGQWDTFSQFNLNTDLVKHKIVPVRSNSVDAAARFTDQIHFLFIDADHSYEGVFSDTNAWLDKVAPHGIVVMHDWGWAEGIKRVVDEIVKPRLLHFETLPNMFWGWKL